MAWHMAWHLALTLGPETWPRNLAQKLGPDTRRRQKSALCRTRVRPTRLERALGPLLSTPRAAARHQARCVCEPRLVGRAIHFAARAHLKKCAGSALPTAGSSGRVGAWRPRV